MPSVDGALCVALLLGPGPTGSEEWDSVYRWVVYASVDSDNFE